MLGNIISIGNSKGVRLPKVLLSESGLGTQIEFKVKKGEIKIVAAKKSSKKQPKISSELLMSLKALDDWNDPEEDKAWAKYQ